MVCGDSLKVSRDLLRSLSAEQRRSQQLYLRWCVSNLWWGLDSLVWGGGKDSEFTNGGVCIIAGSTMADFLIQWVQQWERAREMFVLWCILDINMCCTYFSFFSLYFNILLYFRRVSMTQIFFVRFTIYI